MKAHGTRFNCIENNASKSEHGMKQGGNHKKKGEEGGAMSGQGMFGGSFWSQLDSEDMTTFDDFLPRVGEMNDSSILAEVARLS